MKLRALPIILAVLAIAGLGKLDAQVITTPDSVTWLSPLGPWALCLSSDPATVAMATGAGFCDAPPADSYLLLYKGPASNATWYQYTITAIVADSPTPITVTGVWKRNDNVYGWSSVEVSIPGLVTSFTSQISGLTPILPRVTTVPSVPASATTTNAAARR